MPKYLPLKVSERGGRLGEAYSSPVLRGRLPAKALQTSQKETRRAEDHRHRCSQGCRGVAEVQGGHDRRVVGGRVGRVELRCDGWQQPSREHLGRPRHGGLPGSAAFVLAGIGGGGGTSRDDPTGDHLHQEVARSLVVAEDPTGRNVMATPLASAGRLVSRVIPSVAWQRERSGSCAIAVVGLWTGSGPG